MLHWITFSILVSPSFPTILLFIKPFLLFLSSLSISRVCSLFLSHFCRPIPFLLFFLSKFRQILFAYKEATLLKKQPKNISHYFISFLFLPRFVKK